jgi:hypothetical protein
MLRWILRKLMVNTAVDITCFIKLSRARICYICKEILGPISECFDRIRYFSFPRLPVSCNNQFNIQQLYALLTLHLCVLYLSENKQRFVPLAA